MAFEIRRKVFHALGCIVLLLLVDKGLFTWVHFLVLLIVGSILSYLSTRVRVPVIAWFLDTFDRKGQRIPGRGALAMVLGFFLLLLFVRDMHIVYASVMVLAFGDTFTSLIGLKLAQAKHLRKTRHPFNARLLEGTLFGILAASLGAMLFVSIAEAVAGSVLAMTAESIEIKVGKHAVDDNVLIPLLAATGMMAIRFI